MMGRSDDNSDQKRPGEPSPKPADREARLAQALRANLLKRKEKTRARDDRPPPRQEGRQS